MENNYSISKQDLFSCFIERCINLTKGDGITSMITLQNWMFLDNFINLSHLQIQIQPSN